MLPAELLPPTVANPNNKCCHQVDEKDNAWKLTAAIMHLGEMTFKTKGREEGCEPDDMDPGAQFNRTYFCLSFSLKNHLSFGLRFLTPIKSSKWVV